MTRDDDTPTALPAPDDVADAAEKARARAFGELIEKVLSGRPPAAVPADERALLEVATVIRAAARPVELDTLRTRSIVESALATAIERKGGGHPTGSITSPTDPGLRVRGGVIPLSRARGRRLAPWLLSGLTTAVAAAAIAALVLRPATTAPTPDGALAPAPVAVHLRSRPADALIGVITAAPTLDAASGAVVLRIDTIYADRLAGFRERTLAGTTRAGVERPASSNQGGRP